MLAFACNASAATWNFLLKNEIGEFHINSDSIRSVGDKKYMEVKLNAANVGSDGSKSRLLGYLISCNENTYELSTVKLYPLNDLQGPESIGKVSPNIKPTEAKPNTQGQVYVDAVCGGLSSSNRGTKNTPQTTSTSGSTESRWEGYYSNDEFPRYYYNVSTLRGTSNLREVDVLVNYINQNDEKASAWQTYQVKCNEVQLRLLTSRYFQGFNLQGEKKTETANPNNRFDEPVERTHELNLYSVACRDAIKAQIVTVRSGKSREGQIDLSKVKLLVLPDGRYRIFLTRNKNEDNTYWTNVSWVDCEKGRMAVLSTDYITSQNLVGSSSARSFSDHAEANAICLLKETELPSTTPASLASLPEFNQLKSLEKAYASKTEQNNQRASILNRRKPEIDTTIAKRGPVYGYALTCQGRPFNSPSEAIPVNCNDSRAVFGALRDAWAQLRSSKDQMEPSCWGMVKMAKDYIERVPGGAKLLIDAAESMFAQCNSGLQNEARNGEFFRYRRQLYEVWSCDMLETGSAKNTNFVKGNAPVPRRYKHFETANLNGQISYGFASDDIVKGNEWKPEISLAFQPDRAFERRSVSDIKIYHEVYFFENNSQENDVLGAIRRVFIDFGNDLWARGQCKLIVR